MGAEEALIYLGGNGLWQMATYFAICVLYAVPSMWQSYAIVFEGFTSHRYHCNVGSNETDRLISNPLSCSYESCRMYKYNSTYKPAETTTCTDGYTFYEDHYFPDKGSTIAIEFDLWCNMVLVEISQMCFMGGIVVGCFVLGPLSDIFGRKKVFFGGQFVMVLFGVAMAFSTDIVLYSLFQFLTGAFAMANDLAGYVLGNELFPADIRSYLAPAMNLFNVVGKISLVIFGYYIRHWRDFQFAVSMIPLITMLYWWHCPESVRWLLVNDRYDEAKAVLDECAKCNEVPPVPEDIIKMEPPEVATGSKHTTLWQYLRTRKTLVYFVVVVYEICICQLIMYGLTLMAQTLPGDFFLSFFILSAIEIPSGLLSMFVLYYFGRRIPMCVLNLLCAISLGLSALFTAKPELVAESVDASVLVTTLSCLAKFFGSAAWCIVLVYSQEIFPTNIRSAGVGALAGLGFLGPFVSPLAVTASRVSPYIPTAVFAGLMLIAVGTSLLAPETKGRVLPTTLEEILSWGYTLTEEDKLKFKEQKRQMSEYKKRIMEYRAKLMAEEQKGNKSSFNGSTNPGYQPDKNKKDLDNTAL